MVGDKLLIQGRNGCYNESLSSTTFVTLYKKSQFCRFPGRNPKSYQSLRSTVPNDEGDDDVNVQTPSKFRNHHNKRRRFCATVVRSWRHGRELTFMPIFILTFKSKIRWCKLRSDTYMMSGKRKEMRKRIFRIWYLIVGNPKQFWFRLFPRALFRFRCFGQKLFRLPTIGIEL